MDGPSHALLELGRALRTTNYEFVTVTPETHARVQLRRPRHARSLRDVFGWSLPFEPGTLPGAMVDLLRDAGALVESQDGHASAVRFSSLASHLFVHSAYPTTDAASVFFGPDTYRFCSMLLARAPRSPRCIVDVGCGTGAGGIVLAPRAARVVLADVNDEALRFARVNAALAGRESIEVVHSDVLSGVEGEVDLVIANPPYLADDARRLYRDGGGTLGEALSVRIVVEALERLQPGGKLLLYTGTPFVDGRDVFREAVGPALSCSAATFVYGEIDPDVFGEELDRPVYASVERIAAVTLEATRS
jgi:tRNA1(Val) A37 N6-methylase TrmN6